MYKNQYWRINNFIIDKNEGMGFAPDLLIASRLAWSWPFFSKTSI
ncbi:hypothetical protein [Spiroplasma tabanidicola]|nr:hypothetical protein [Spiroplasma tabanidicola]